MDFCTAMFGLCQPRNILGAIRAVSSKSALNIYFMPAEFVHRALINYSGGRTNITAWLATIHISMHNVY